MMAENNTRTAMQSIEHNRIQNRQQDSGRILIITTITRISRRGNRIGSATADSTECKTPSKISSRITSRIMAEPTENIADQQQKRSSIGT